MLKMYTSNSNKKGLTLTEILFSAAIITLVMTGVLIVFVQTIDISKRIDYEYTALNFAKNRIERARTIAETSGFDFLPDLSEADTILDSDGASDPNGDFKRSTGITLNHNGVTRLTKVEVSVIYKYRNEWKDDIPISATTLFVDME